MAKNKALIEPADIGKPIEASIQEGMKDPEYRRNYMLYQVRTAIAAVIRSLRESRDMTQKELADKAGVPQPQIARLESVDDERIPTLEQLVRIFTALDSRAFLEIVPPLQTHAEKREIVLV
ncbi:MAG: helix-turn-helix transcriptional regulator [Elusimicrobia bacterium]|nr:helix-turn-helix transcriptional regulator [Elusimicrobiota bacterium]